MTPKIAREISANAARNNELLEVERIVTRAYERIRIAASSGEYLLSVDTTDLKRNRAAFLGALNRLIDGGFKIVAYDMGLTSFSVCWKDATGFTKAYLEANVGKD